MNEDLQRDLIDKEMKLRVVTTGLFNIQRV